MKVMINDPAKMSLCPVVFSMLQQENSKTLSNCISLTSLHVSSQCCHDGENSINIERVNNHVETEKLLELIFQKK